LEPQGSNYYKIRSKYSGNYLDIYYHSKAEKISLIQHRWQVTDSQLWTIEKVSDETTNNQITRANAALQAKLNLYNPANDRLTQLIQILKDVNQGRDPLDRELREVTTRLATLQQEINTLTTNYLELVSTANNTAQSMTDLGNQTDPRGLKVKGALLPFAQAASRLHALESCTGRVTLSYQDRAGNLRQTHYDSAYDADGKGEQWLPEGYRVALKLDETKTAPTLPPAIFNSIGNQITIEFWAKGSEALPKAVTFLGARNTHNATCLRIQLPNENGEVVWEVGLDSGSKTIDRLQVATEIRFYRESWTHWAFVKNCDKGEMCIYRNGKLFYKNDPKAKENPVVLSQPIVGVTEAKLGGFPGSNDTKNWSGQITELRIWNVALGERELETNSLLTLSGNEPGLVAYYPVNEAQGDDIRDLTGKAAHKLTIADAVWTPCTAPIGRFSSAIELLNSPTKFDGTTTVDETSLNDQAGGPNMTASSSEIEALKQQIKTKNAEIKTKKAEKKAEENKPHPDSDKVVLLQKQIDDLKEEVNDLEEQKQELMEEEQDANQADVEQRQKEIEAVHSDLSAREHASTSFAAWQRTMESLQVRAGKRNIVNTYIWDADGGFHAEEQQFASTIEHSIGGSFDLSIALGGKAKIAISKVLVESNVYATTKLTQTMRKTEASSKGMELRVNLNGVESRGITDHRDYPILPGEKVDRYRFMSFYLEKKVDHWHDFFNQVVDPEWLASNDEEARALRQTQNALPNEVWRVLHRVTYVERPALMGFGHQQPPRVQVADEMQKLRSQVSELTAKRQGIDDKLNRLLEGK
jgi:hypothetical protein